MKPCPQLARGLIALVLLAQAAVAGAQTSAPAESGAPLWIGPDHAIHLYFFWSETCPHCLEARPFVVALSEQNPWIRLHEAEISRNQVNLERYFTMARGLNQEARSVPAFLFCGRMLVGYDSAETTGAFLQDALTQCRESQRRGKSDGPKESGVAPVYVPLLGELNTAQWSLPALTVALALLDSFNPCAFFVLLFLLSLLVHAGSRTRMLFIGGTFIVISGLVYFLFMGAWLNLFFIFGQSPQITAAAGVVAVAIGAINIKDFFWFKRGVSLSIPESAKPSIFKHARDLLQARGVGALFLGTVVLAVAANTYELLCTAGFPLVYTRALTLHDLTTMQYYGYLLAYNALYVLPLLLIVFAFTFTLGARKLTEKQGRLLKLVSGLMMFELGLVLVVAPQWLNNALIAIALLAIAVALSAIISRIRQDA